MYYHPTGIFIRIIASQHIFWEIIVTAHFLFLSFFLTTQGTQSILFALLLSGAQNTPAVLFYSVKSFNAHLFLNPPPLFLFRLSLFGFSGFSSNFMLTNNILLLFTCLPYIFLLPVYMCFSIYTYSYIRYTTVYKTSFLATRHSLLSPPFHPKQSFL